MHLFYPSVLFIVFLLLHIIITVGIPFNVFESRRGSHNNQGQFTHAAVFLVMSKSTTKFADCGFEDFLLLEEQEKARDALRNRKRANTRRKKNKKPNPQKKVRQYFPTKKNVQGFPMRLCKYQPDEGEHMYQPPGYGVLYNSSLTRMAPATYCKGCQLQPCVTMEYSDEMFTTGAQLVVADGKSEADAGAVISEALQKRHCKLFKMRYSAKRSRPTKCISDFVSRHYWSQLGTEDESDSEEEYELLFGSTAMAAASVCHKKGWKAS